MDSSPSYKVLILPSWYLPEGGQFCKDQALFLKERGLDVHILANVTLPWKKYKIKAFTYPWGFHSSVEDGVLTYRNYYRRIPRLEKANINAWSRRTVQLFDMYVKEHGLPDVIHAHSSMWAGYAAYLIKQKYGVPYVVTEHRGRFGLSILETNGRFKPFYNDYLVKTFSNASYIIPVSDQQIARINSFLRQFVPMKVVSNVLDTTFFCHKTRERQPPFTFVAMNSFDQVKGYDILLPAFDLLCNKDPNVRLNIGGDGFDCDEFQFLFKKLVNKDKISFKGLLTTSEVRSELYNADAFVLPSRIEAQPISVLEALSTGLPVVCTEVVPTTVVGNQQGYRVAVDDIIALSEVMLHMINNVTRFDSKSISNHLYSIAGKNVVVDQIIQIYKEVL